MIGRADQGWRARLSVGRNLIAVLDVGSHKLCCYIARARPDGSFMLLGRGYQAADGLRRGEILDPDAAELALQAVLQEAEEQAGEQIREIVVALSGGRPRSRLVRVTRALESGKVGELDVLGALAEARDTSATQDVVALHVLPVEMSIDGGRVLKDARGLSGTRLELVANVVSVDRAPLETVLACLERCHLEVRRVVASAYAAGVGCLQPEELEGGCLLIDIGGDVTQIAHFSGGQLLFVDQVAKGGAKITTDLEQALSTGRREAERIKTLYGCVVHRSCDDNHRVPVALVGDYVDQPSGEVPRTRLTFIIRSRMEDIFHGLVERMGAVQEVFGSRPPRSIVLTGGGSEIDGLEEFAEEVFGRPARVGRPLLIDGSLGSVRDACCSAATGSLLLATRRSSGLDWSDAADKNRVNASLAKFRYWLRQNF